MFEPKVKKESYKDEKPSIRNGKFAYYNAAGLINSSGQYSDGRMNGSQYYRDENGQIIKQKDFGRGIFMDEDSIPHKMDNKDNPNPGEVESEFPGGIASWDRFLNKNLRYPDRAVNAQITGKVRLEFVVDIDGTITEADKNRSVQYSMDEESLRIINMSAKWVPGSKDKAKAKQY